MPSNKNQRIRCLILDNCFRNNSKKYQIDDLIHAVNEGLAESLPNGGTISRRTIYNDIAFMKSPEGGLADIQKTKDGTKTYYAYKDPNFSISGNPFNEEERQYLKLLISTLSSFKGLPQMQTLRETIENIQILSLDNHDTPYFEFEENPFIEGIEYLQYFYNAIVSKSPQQIEYKPYGKSQTTYRFHPQYIKQYNKRWYVAGVTSNYPSKTSLFPLDRIIKTTPLKESYIESTINWQDYWEDVIGITVPNEKVESVTLWVYGNTRYYFQSNPLHGSQRIKELDNDRFEVKLSVKINFEIKRLLLSYADCIEVISPSWLREEHSYQLAKALQRYSLR